MNDSQEENEFRAGLADLVEDVLREFSPEASHPYARTSEQIVQERTTRSHFLDNLFDLLGWRLGLHGNVGEEVRLKAGTTTFMDYLGFNETTQAPVLLVEAKAWGTPFVMNRSGAEIRRTERELLVAAIEHVKLARPKDTSPVTGSWHDFLVQLRGYVDKLKNTKGHDLPRAVLSSGDWIVVFKSPTETFLDGDVNDEQFAIFKREAYVERAHEIFRLLRRKALADIVPFSLRPSQLRDYLQPETISAVFYGLHVTYERTGSELFDRQPRILVYPALIFQRDDETLVTAIGGNSPIVMDTKDVGDDGEKSLVPHLREVAQKAAALLEDCSKEMHTSLTPLDLSGFPGFSEPASHVDATNNRKEVVRPLKTAANEWLLVTGALPHYLKEEPTVHPCRFHTWANCHETGCQIGTAAVSTPRTKKPRSFFVDMQIHHCAHQTVQDRRQSRCNIAPLDERTCCRVCVYEGLCWTPAELRQLPCGS